jgi:hypothetical protein
VCFSNETLKEIFTAKTRRHQEKPKSMMGIILTVKALRSQCLKAKESVTFGFNQDSAVLRVFARCKPVPQRGRIVAVDSILFGWISAKQAV